MAVVGDLPDKVSSRFAGNARTERRATGLQGKLASIMVQSTLYGKSPNAPSPSGNWSNTLLGIYFVLFIRTMAVLSRRNIMKSEMYRVMITTAVVMWIVATGVCHPRFFIRHQVFTEPSCHV